MFWAQKLFKAGRISNLVSRVFGGAGRHIGKREDPGDEVDILAGKKFACLE